MNKTIVVTGATGAIGAAVAREIAKHGINDLILLGRNTQKLQLLKDELNRIGPKVSIEIIQAHLNSIRSVQKKLLYGK